MCIASALIAADPLTVKGLVALPDDEVKHTFVEHSLPIHLLPAQYNRFLPVSEEDDILRLLRRHYPESISIQDINGQFSYDHAVDINSDLYFIHMLLRGDPTLLHDLSCQERRSAMFLAYRAIVKDRNPTIWAMLRFANEDLLKRVIICYRLMIEEFDLLYEQ